MLDCALSREHDRISFTSGNVQLDNYLQTGALQNVKKGLATVWVLTDESAPSVILGFYSLSAASVEATDLAANEKNSLPRYPVPCILLGRLAVSSNNQGRGTGRALVNGAIRRSLVAKQQVGAYALLVTAKDIAAKLFYERCGFTAFPAEPLRLYQTL